MRVKQFHNVLDWIEGWPFSISVVQGQLSPSQTRGLEQAIEVHVCLCCGDVYLKHLRFAGSAILLAAEQDGSAGDC